MTRLSVNVNKIALLRNARGGHAPDLLALSHLVMAAGADGLTVHPRADRRHITPQDARDIRRTFPTVEVNFEGDLREEFLDLVLAERPDQCTLVPVSYGEVTSNRGWDSRKWAFLLRPVIDELRRNGVRSSMFVEPTAEAVDAAADTGVDRVELYTAAYADAFRAGAPELELARLVGAAEMAQRRGLGLNAGHDLTAENLRLLRRYVPTLDEVSIGHHLVSEALVEGLGHAVARYKEAASGG